MKENRGGKNKKQEEAQLSNLRATLWPLGRDSLPPSDLRQIHFAMNNISNELPQHVVGATSVHDFQHQLMQITCTRCEFGDAN